jgi:parallel beta-helix repeat protein
MLASQKQETFAEFGASTAGNEVVTILRSPIPYGDNAPITITRPGVYTLGNPITAAAGSVGITINAAQVTLDLGGYTLNNGATGILVNGNNVTVKNGTLSGSTASGITLSGNRNCRIENIDVISSPTGFTLLGGGSHLLTNCRALQNTSAGFSLISSSTNSFVGCQALNQSGDHSIYGFYADTGKNNIFDSCVASGGRTSSTSTAEIIGGFAFNAQLGSKIVNSHVSDMQAINAGASSYGIYIPQRAPSLFASANAAPGANVYATAWSPNGRFVATGGYAGGTGSAEIHVYAFDATTQTLTEITTAATVTGNPVWSLAWSPDGNYLAVGLQAESNNVLVYSWDETTLSLLDTKSVGNDPFLQGPPGALCVAWDPMAPAWAAGYLAVSYYSAGNGDPDLTIFSWSGDALNAETSINALDWQGSLLLTNVTRSIAWTPGGSYIAVAGVIEPTTQAACLARIFKFDIYQYSLTQVAQTGVASPGEGNPISFSVSWAPNSSERCNYYCAIGSRSATVYQFNPAGTLTPIATASPTTTDIIESVAWAPEGIYLVTGGQNSGAQVYQFSPSAKTLAKIMQATPAPGNTVRSIAVSPDGNYFAVGGDTASSQEERIYTFLLAEHNNTSCTIQNNQINNIKTASATGVGIDASSGLNTVIQNNSSDNDTNYFNVALLSSRANSRGVENIDSSMCTADQITQIQDSLATLVLNASTNQETWSIESKCECISSKIDTLPPLILPELWSIESKTEVISSKIDVPAACAPTTITSGGVVTGKSPILISSPATLSDSGCYCLAQDLNVTSGDGITISGNMITLDLNGYTIRKNPSGTLSTGIAITGDNATVKNGTIVDASTIGVSLSGNNNCRIENVDVVGSPTGFLLQNSGANLITNCRALQNTGAGFSLVSSSTNSIIGCQALNQSGDHSIYGFYADTGKNNIFDSCVASGGRTSSTSTAEIIGGFAFNAQLGSKILNSRVSDMQALVSASAYGMYLQDIFTSAKPAPGDTVYATSWSPNGSYVATGGGTNSTEIHVYSFDAVNKTLTEVTTVNTGVAVLALSWSPDGNYLAVGLEAATNNVAIYSWDTSNLSLEDTKTAGAHAARVLSTAWSPDGSHLAVTHQSNGVADTYITIYSWDGAVLTSRISQGSLDNIYRVPSVSWSFDGSYIILNKINIVAMSGQVDVYRFTSSPYALTFVVAAYNTFGYDAAVAWSPANNYYFTAFDQYRGYMYQFDPSINSVTQIASAPYQNNFSTNNAAVSWPPTGNYIVSGDDNGIHIYQFSTTDLTFRNVSNITTKASINSVSVSPDDSYIVAGGDTVDNQQTWIYPFLTNYTFLTSNGCIIQNNLVNDIKTAANTGIGIKANSSFFYIAQNTSSNNDINYQDIVSELITSQANARGAKNIDCSLTTPDGVSQLVNLSICSPIPLTQPASENFINLLTTANYCFATDIAATVSLQAPNINLCLNNRTLTGRLIIDAANAVITNGTIYAPDPYSYDCDSPAISISSRGTGASIKNIAVTCQNSSGTVAGRTGIKIGASNASIENCSIQSGSAGTGKPGGHGIEILSGCQSAHIRTTDIIGTGAGINQPGGNGIQLDSGCANVEIRNCTFMSTGTGNSETGSLAIYDNHAASTANYTSAIWDNFAYCTSNVPPYAIRNKGSAGVSQGVNIISGTPGNYANAYVPAGS